jgi:hypothetical protein
LFEPDESTLLASTFLNHANISELPLRGVLGVVRHRPVRDPFRRRQFKMVPHLLVHLGLEPVTAKQRPQAKEYFPEFFHEFDV